MATRSRSSRVGSRSTQPRLSVSPAPLSSHGRLALFIDGSNFYHTIRDLGIHIDYRRLLEYFAAQGDLRRATYYTALLDDNPPDWLVRLTDWLSYNGYRVVTKPARTFRRRVHTDVGSEHWVLETQGNVDVELAVDMRELAPHLDTLILFSGDGDFLSAIEAVQRLGCRVIVVSSEKTSDSTVADELRRCADQFIDIVSIADEVCMQDR